MTARSLISRWHQQAELHAALAPATILILQVCRFHFEADNQVATKRRYRVVPDPYLDVPCFTGVGPQCRDMLYRLNSVVIHLGEAPVRGHYQSILHGETMAYLADDGKVAQPVSQQFVDHTQKDSYLLVYLKC